LVAIVIAPSDDSHALSVMWEIKQRGDDAVLLDMRDFPLSWALTFASRGRELASYSLKLATGRVILDSEITGLWWRRSGKFRFPDELEIEEHRRICRNDCTALFEGWIYSLQQRVINPFAAEQAARCKTFQLTKALACGFNFLNTIASNSPAAVEAFVRDRKVDFGYKSLTTSKVGVETRVFDEAATANLERLHFSPCIFQTRVIGGVDVRATVVDGQVFAAEVHATHPKAAVDWRLDPAIEVRPHDLPANIENSICKMQAELGLRYGAYDLRTDEGGTYWFFEVNPGGQYLFVEIEAGLKISREIAKCLLAGPAGGRVCA
jgi:hypothetical protein